MAQNYVADLVLRFKGEAAINEATSALFRAANEAQKTEAEVEQLIRKIASMNNIDVDFTKGVEAELQRLMGLLDDTAGVDFTRAEAGIDTMADSMNELNAATQRQVEAQKRMDAAAAGLTQQEGALDTIKQKAYEADAALEEIVQEFGALAAEDARLRNIEGPNLSGATSAEKARNLAGSAGMDDQMRADLLGMADTVDALERELYDAEDAFTQMGKAAQAATEDARVDLMLASEEVDRLEANLRATTQVVAKDFGIHVDPNGQAVQEANRVMQALRQVGQAGNPAVKELQKAMDGLRAKTGAAEDAAQQLVDANDRLGRSANGANTKTTLLSQNMIRVIQDAPYGIMGMANNFQALAESIAMAGGKGQSMGKAITGALKSMVTGPMAIPLIITLVTVLAQSWDKVEAKIKDVGIAVRLLSRTQREYADSVREGEEEAEKAFADLIDSMPHEEVQRLAGNYEDVTVLLEKIRSLENSQSAGRNSLLAMIAYAARGGDEALSELRNTLQNELGPAFDNMNMDVDDVADAMDDFKSHIAMTESAIRKYVEQTNRADQAHGRFKEALSEVQSVVVSAYGAMAAAAPTDIGFARLAAQAEEAAERTAIATKYMAAEAAQSNLALIRQTEGVTSEAAREAEAHIARMAQSMGLTFNSITGEIRDFQGRNLDDLRQMELRAARIAAEGRVRQARERAEAEAERQRREAEQRRREAERIAKEAEDARRMRRDSALAAIRDRLALREGEEEADRQLAETAHQEELNRIADQVRDRQITASAAAAARTLAAQQLRERLVTISREYARIELRTELEGQRQAAEATASAEETRISQREAALRLELAQRETTQEAHDRAMRGLARERVAAEEALRVEEARIEREYLEAEQAAIQEAVEARGRASAEQEAALAEVQRGLDALAGEGEAAAAAAEAALAVITAAGADATSEFRELAQEARDATDEIQLAIDVLTAQAQVGQGGIVGRLRATLGVIRAEANQERGELEAEIDRLRAQLGGPEADELADLESREGNLTPEEDARLAQLRAVHAEIEAEIRRHQAEIGQINQTEQQDRKDAMFSHWEQVASVTSQALGNLSGMSQTMYQTWRDQRAAELDQLGYSEEEKNKVLEKEGKKRFFIMKALMIAETIGNTITATMAAFKFGNQIGGPILGGVFAASAAAFGAAQIARLMALTPDGGSAGGAAGGAGGSLASGGFTALNGTIVADRVRDYETNRRAGTFGDNGYDKAASRMEDAADRMAETAANMTVTMEDRTSEQSYLRGKARNERLNA